MKVLSRLILNLKRLPGVGPKQAERLALHLARTPSSEVEELVSALREVKQKLRACRLCFDFTDRELCATCSDEQRDHGLLCVVEDPQDVQAIERSRGYKGLYHVLHGCLSPLDGIGPESLRVSELQGRLKDAGNQVREVILATDADTEGEATALYLAQLLKDPRLKITRIAQGIPLGGDLDYVDERTLSQALSGRREV